MLAYRKATNCEKDSPLESSDLMEHFFQHLLLRTKFHNILRKARNLPFFFLLFIITQNTHTWLPFMLQAGKWQQILSNLGRSVVQWHILPRCIEKSASSGSTFDLNCHLASLTESKRNLLSLPL